ncbi:hypothetical protein [uncultured Methylobacterium sp.]|uniref:hypothetical protein n=1 Tax=uncultured Methylobacterium sp. TaxID=157278 RepID=UPI0025953AC6|nr:hypothetical protein [uncultured Methylobacterium sp.]
MKIVLAGQLDRVHANALARRADDEGVGQTERWEDMQSETDRLLFGRAGTLAALSSTVVTAPDWDAIGEGSFAAPRRKDLSFAPGMSLTKRGWARLYEEAAGLVKAMAFLGSYSKRSLATLEEISAPDAWVDDDSPRSLRRADLGATHAYLTDLLLQPFVASQVGALLVITEADCHLLADVATFLVEGGRPRPFPIPDLRGIVRPDGARVSGKIASLGLRDLADVDAARKDPSIQAYARQLQSIFWAPELFDLGVRLEAALAGVGSTGTRFEEADVDLALIVEDARLLSNTDVRVAPHGKELARLARRRFAPQDLRTLVLV